MEEKKFDVLILGTGVAGKTVAEKCVSEGLKVAIIEKMELGGTCANKGCDPKKVLLAAAEVMQRATDLKGKGIRKKPILDWKALQKFKRTFTSDIPSKTRKDLKDKNIALFTGTPKFIGPNTVQINALQIEADKIVIATGLVTRQMDMEGHDHLKDSTDFLALKNLPKRIVFLGAGYIGMEFAQMAARAGSKVTVVDHGEGILNNFDSDLAKLVEQDSQNLGIQFIFNAKAISLKRKKKTYKLDYKTGESEKTLKTDLIFNTSGRVPAIADLDLPMAHIDFNANGVAVNVYLQSTTNSSIFACGDVSDHSLPLSPLSGFEGHIVGQNIIKNTMRKIETPLVPSVVFTMPNLASVGYSEEEARSRYKNIIVKKGEVANWYSNKRINGSTYAYKILINERTDEIVGVHLLSMEAAETINLFTMAMNQKMTAREIKKTIFTYPTWSNDIKSMLA